MLNEIASSIDDRPLLRTPQRIDPHTEETPRDGSAKRGELRGIVGSVLTIEREYFPRPQPPTSKNGAILAPFTGHADGGPPPPESLEKLGESLAVLGGDSQYIGTFEGRLALDSATAYDLLDTLLQPLNYLALFREQTTKDGIVKHVIHLIAGRPQIKPRSWAINVILLIATFFSVLIVGTSIALGEIGLTDPAFANRLGDNFFLELWRGLPYGLSILLILGAHELGHYFAARRHRIAVTLPYFIPAPFISMLGTFGAFIQLREPLKNRNALLDVGAAGPLVGFIFAVPILIIGLATSIVSPIQPGATVEGNSLLYALAKTLVFGRFLPDGSVDVLVNQLAWAGWTGLLVTALNLIPLGQLDGGHILYALIGERARLLFVPLLVGMAALVVLVSDTWLFWLILLFFFGRVYATPLDMITPLTPRRRWIGWLGLVVLLVTFVPVPFTVAEGSPAPPAIRDAVQYGLPIVIGLVLARRR